MAKIMVINGTKIPVAWEEYVLFFNNHTIVYGTDQLDEGMTNQECLVALECAGFTEVMSKAFIEELKSNGSVLFVDGLLTYAKGNR